MTATPLDNKVLRDRPEASRSRLVWIVIAQLLLAACATGAHVFRDRAGAALEEETRAAAAFRAELLQTEIKRYRALPSVLSHDSDIVAALNAPTPDGIAELNRKLQQITVETDLNVLYVLNLKGFGIATGSNPDERRLYCRAGCSQRFYYSEALRAGAAQFVSLGRIRQRAGLYFSHLVTGESGKALGVIVAKAEFAPIEERWRKLGNTAFVADENGVIIISSVPAWLGKTVKPLEPGLRQRILATKQFGSMPLNPLGLDLGNATRRPTQISAALGPGAPTTTSVVASAPLDIPGWRLFLFQPAGHVLNAATLTGIAIVLLAGVLILTLGAIMLRRYERRQAELRRQISMRQELERQVAERTHALRSANSKLLSEMEGRRRMEGDLHRMQDELVQANKLAALGQIAAGVAHEVNQPLAAIRTYAASGRKFMQRGKMEDAANNFSVINDLTDRIKVITDELRAFARRTPRKLGPVSVDDAINGALLLVNHRLQLESVTLRRSSARPGLVVIAERIRLEQILVNLLQNALDALSKRSDPAIDLIVEAAADRVRITVRDNGPGLSNGVKKALFMPFSTTKAHGLGLGLVICREIATEMGGELVLNPGAQGASFTLTLNMAANPVRAAPAALATT